MQFQFTWAGIKFDAVMGGSKDEPVIEELREKDTQANAIWLMDSIHGDAILEAAVPAAEKESRRLHEEAMVDSLTYTRI